INSQLAFGSPRCWQPNPLAWPGRLTLRTTWKRPHLLSQTRQSAEAEQFCLTGSDGQTMRLSGSASGSGAGASAFFPASFAAARAARRRALRASFFDLSTLGVSVGCTWTSRVPPLRASLSELKVAASFVFLLATVHSPLGESLLTGRGDPKPF